MTTSSKKVLVLRGDSYKDVGELFASRGMEVLHDVESLPTANVVVFTGGSDVHPAIYGQDFSGARGCNLGKDLTEMGIFGFCTQRDIPMIGICRGGQLLNVLNGGYMLQDHGLISGIVRTYDEETGDDYYMHVDHHQGMYDGVNAIVSMRMSQKLYSDTCYEVWYPQTKSLCVQYHPEWGHEPTKNRFFELIERYEVFK